MFVLANMWFQTLMRQFFFNIDKIVFGFISTIYDFLITIARTSVLSQADIIDMADRIYKLLAIFMIFKVTFSLIMYVVNPDDFSDKNKGIAKLGTNIVISLALLILTPYIFSYAYQLQTIILEDNSLSALIFGEANANSTESPFESAGDSMAYITMAPFFIPNGALDELYECTQLTTRDAASGNVIFNPACSGLNSKYESTDDSESLHALTIDNDRFTEQTLKNYVAGVSTGNLGLMFRQDIAVATNEDNTEYIIEYKYLFSTVIGIVVVLLLITFCMDVALRSIKLAFLQLIAPIPIISYVDPKSGKDGMFKKWVDMCVKTYISLFIRLLAIYFAAYIISRIDKMVDIVDGSYVSNLLVKIFIIIGALMFAKDFTKILEGLGVKLDGGFTLNPLKKMEDSMLGGKKIVGFGKGAVGAAGAMGAATLASTAGAIGNIRSRWNSTDDKDKWKLVAGGVTSGLSAGLKAGAKGMAGAMRGEKMGKNFTNSYKQAMSSEKKRMDRISDGVSAGEVMLTNLQQSLGIRTSGENVKYASEAYKRVSEKYSAAKNNIVAADGVAKDLDAQLKVLESTSISRESFYQKDKHGRIIDGTFDEDAYNKAINELTTRKKQIGDAIDTRVKDIMTGQSEIYSGGKGIVVQNAQGKWTYDTSGVDTTSTRLETNTEYVRQLNEEMVKEGTFAENVARSVDADFGGAVISTDDPKTTAKSSQTAASAINTSDEASHATKVGKYTNNNSKN